MTNRYRHRPLSIKREKGSTLIGAMISILIMNIGMAALFNLYINNTLNSAHSRHVSTALTYAREKIEALRFDNSTTTTTLESGHEELQNQTIHYQRSWNIITYNTLEYRLIRVSMHWQDSSGDHNITLNTVITDFSPHPLPFSEL